MTLLEKQGEISAGLIALLDPEKKIMHLRYMALNREMANTYHPTYAIYWEAVNKAYELGYKRVCFGTNTKNDQDRSYRIKSGFGCEYVDNFAELMPMNSLYDIFYKMYRHL
jgi:lipid II:glycine glycyltransferase (peptidoglycan interpeptide bridge formation enzyme)